MDGIHHVKEHEEVDLERLSVCCGAKEHSQAEGFCAKCRDHAGFELHCPECNDIVGEAPNA